MEAPPKSNDERDILRLSVRVGSGGACRVRRLTITRTMAHCTHAWWCSGLRS
jgi:hypothetical protein